MCDRYGIATDIRDGSKASQISYILDSACCKNLVTLTEKFKRKISSEI